MRWTTMIAGLGALAVSAGTAAASTLTHAYDFSSSHTVGGSTYAVDLVGGADGVLTGAAGISGGALDLTRGGTVDFSSYLIPTGGGSDFSVYLRVQGAAAGGIQEIISQGYSGAPGFYIGPNGASDLRLGDSKGDIGYAFPFGAGFHDLLLVNDYTHNAMSFFVDGASVYTSTAMGIGGGGTQTRLGNQFCCYSEQFAGRIDTVKIFSGVATNAEAVASLGGAVPEPASWALLIVGFGGIGATLRRARVAAAS